MLCPEAHSFMEAVGLALSSDAHDLTNLHSFSPGKMYWFYFRWETVEAMNMPVTKFPSLGGSHQCDSNKSMINTVWNNFLVKLPRAWRSIRDWLTQHPVIPRAFPPRIGEKWASLTTCCVEGSWCCPSYQHKGRGCSGAGLTEWKE